MEKLMNKLNNIERNVGWVERDYYLDGRVWWIGPATLFVDGRVANSREVKEFLKLKKEFDGS